ncbi:phospholipid carrier-dependent glycosyltransferase [Arenimonas donghaensis]|uniref:Glycosyl transferase family 39/83 domain-containing protein n=1 Tax=Arenimonas donghaensis DSM 18148 = HO3-R19 TaxID=1121014 RepID=A0A087MKD0_9GAMM|nr:phospholipid carrier-dependent glycosyltransferase [Arenimonas donghaensis]KFL37333.1 hypothetical protein N788_10055 [Arenimonas donghaensis DSM 18148 = HO3-R19]
MNNPGLTAAVWGTALLLVLVALAVGRSALGTQRDGFTVDEPWHVVAGVSYRRDGDFRLNPEHPPLMKWVVGAAQGGDFVLPPLPALSEKGHERNWVEEVMFLRNDAAAAQQATRIGMWSFHAALLLALGLLAWRAFGLAAAAGMLAFLAIEPTIAAHLPVAMTDLPLALTLAVASLCTGLMLERWRWPWVVSTGLALGLVLGSKHSALAGLAGLGAVMLAGVFAGVRKGGAREAARRAGKLLLAAVLAWGTLWALYGGQFHASPDGGDPFNRAMADKVGDLQMPAWREGITLADRFRVLPRPYLWGLADTVRAGVEGRGQATHVVWGVNHKGSPPWFTWPGILVAKVPLALLALSLAGLLALPWTRVPMAGRWALGAALAMSALHLVALMSSQGTYGGVRHALPVLVVLALPAGILFAFAWQRRPVWRVAAALPLLAAAATTLGEPRVWEYHNELAGGSADAYRMFANEGLDLGQRWPEIHDFYQREIAPTGLPLYTAYWFMEEQAIAAGINYRRRVETIDDDNVAGVYEGYFVYGMGDTLPMPEYDWDPEEVLRGLEPVERLGYVTVYKGRQVNPKGRAESVYLRVLEHLYEKGGGRDEVVSRRLREVLDQAPYHVGAAIELGNARLRLGDKDGARAAYAVPLSYAKVPVEPLVKAQLEQRIAELEATHTQASDLPPMRNPWME